MKKRKVFAAFVLALFLTSCVSDNVSTKSTGALGSHTIVKLGTDGSISLYEIDGCQYIIASMLDKGITMVHKANCPNPIHVQR